MRVVIDTNVVISAILKDRDPEAVIIFVIKHPDFEWIASAEIIEEYINVLKRPKFKLPLNLIDKWENMFHSFIEVIESGEQIDFPRDQKDAKFLECALASEAEYFITGDRDFEEAGKLVNTIILSVNSFKTLICDKLS
ncbi:Putative toxin-antitoxin system, toxin component, PIN-family [Desulfonema limicola]|uniref:Toxin-antitoxin system, toxin component, PIN-family n=1 Tax=Desulfonema limicola TaxID=45656 RepID=A0A975BDT4_9BACT|nr:putative toxin-antitoxin system toxin component, PIN family [Desulfonema limicola]QTA83463.1 Putative toxin-antitoxin system, toxin component, PIN-family [Desulfonema limicola]